eukprot:4156011-Pleurochrysis_carterae.AAC.1
MHNMSKLRRKSQSVTSVPFCRANSLGGRPSTIRPSRYLTPISSQVSAAPIRRRVVHIGE